MYALINIIFATQIFFTLFPQCCIFSWRVFNIATDCEIFSWYLFIFISFMRNKMQYPICTRCEILYSGVDSRKERTPLRTMAGTLGKVCNLYFEILKILRCLKTSTTTCKIDFFWVHWIYLRARPRRYLSFLHVQHWETFHATIFFMYASYIVKKQTWKVSYYKYRRLNL